HETRSGGRPPPRGTRHTRPGVAVVPRGDPSPLSPRPGARFEHHRHLSRRTTTWSRWRRRCDVTLDPQRWTLKTREAFQGATTQAGAAGNPYVTPSHLVLALLNDAAGIARPLMVAAQLDPISLTAELNEKVAREPRSVGGSQPGLSPEARQGLEDADALRAELGDEYLSVDHVVVAWAPLLGTNRETLLAALRSIRGSARITSENPEETFASLEKYGRDLTALARAGKLDPVIGRDDEIRRVIQVLSRRTKNNPVLIGEPGVGK